MSDTLATLRQLVAPKQGLRPLPLVSESYQVDSTPAVSTRLLNMFAEALPPGSRSAHMLKPTAGTSLLCTLGTGPVRCSAAIAGSYYAISGDTVYRLQDDPIPAPTALGVVGTAGAADTESIAVGLTAVVFCVPPNAWVSDYNVLTPAWQQITTGSGNFPADGANSVCYIDGYFIFTQLTQIFLSKLLDATHFDSLDFVGISSEVDYIERGVAHNGELWLFCQNSVRIWYDTGAADAPFQPRTGGVIPHGIGSARTIVNMDGSLWWLGIDNVVYRTTGYQATRVSNHFIETLIATFDGGYLRNAVACSWMHEGHMFYALSLPQLGRTFVYDVATKVWHERCSDAAGTGRWQINTAMQLSARVILGDAQNGNLYHTSADTPTENGVAVPRIGTLPNIVTHGPRAFMHRLEVEMEVGTADAPGTVTLDWSDDGGVNYNGGPRALSTGAAGATKTRVATTRLGSFRQRVLRLTAMSPMTIYAVDADVPTPTGG
jgi:hypothetical protein